MAIQIEYTPADFYDELLAVADAAGADPCGAYAALGAVLRRAVDQRLLHSSLALRRDVRKGRLPFEGAPRGACAGQPRQRRAREAAPLRRVRQRRAAPPLPPRPKERVPLHRSRLWRGRRPAAPGFAPAPARPQHGSRRGAGRLCARGRRVGRRHHGHRHLRARGHAARRLLRPLGRRLRPTRAEASSTWSVRAWRRAP